MTVRTCSTSAEVRRATPGATRSATRPRHPRSPAWPSCFESTCLLPRSASISGHPSLDPNRQRWTRRLQHRRRRRRHCSVDGAADVATVTASREECASASISRRSRLTSATWGVRAARKHTTASGSSSSEWSSRARRALSRRRSSRSSRSPRQAASDQRSRGVVWPSWSTKRSTPSDSPSELEHRLGHAGGPPAGHPGQLGHRRPDVQVGQAGPTSDEGGFETAVGERMGAAGSEKTAVTADATRAGSAEVSRAGGTRHRTLRAKSIRGPG